MLWPHHQQKEELWKAYFDSKTYKLTNADNIVAETNDSYICSCCKEFKYRQDLSWHKRSCKGDKNIVTSTMENTKSSIDSDSFNAI